MDTCLLWFRRDLRLADNPGLHALLDVGLRPLPVYIHDEPDPDWPIGAASAWWLHHSLHALKKSLQERGSDLLILNGDSQQQLLKLLEQTGAKSVYWNHCYEPAYIERDQAVKTTLKTQCIDVQSFNASLLREPWQLLKNDDTPYRVFAPFWKTLQKTGPIRTLAALPDKFPPPPTNTPKGVRIDHLELLPVTPWYKQFYGRWQPGEAGAWSSLKSFCDERLLEYTQARDMPALSGTSHLSPHLHFGEISPLQIWHFVAQETATDTAPGAVAAGEAYLREMGWREFSYHLLYHFPHTSLEPLNPKFENFPWRKNYSELLACWQKGQTGIPIVDAGMRELWATGIMHNRVRMLVASFLTKNLLIPWQEGARWFWDTLVDADLANNSMGWQWTAGSGADAMPYFRIFNPVLQGERFDKAGSYVRRWVPELEKLENKFIHKPWSADPAILADAGITLGKDYPQPLVELSASRREALAVWNRIKRRIV